MQTRTCREIKIHSIVAIGYSSIGIHHPVSYCHTTLMCLPALKEFVPNSDLLMRYNAENKAQDASALDSD